MDNNNLTKNDINKYNDFLSKQENIPFFTINDKTSGKYMIIPWLILLFIAGIIIII